MFSIFVRTWLMVVGGMVFCPIIVSVYMITGGVSGGCRGCYAMYTYFCELSTNIRNMCQKGERMRYDEFVEKIKLRVTGYQNVGVEWLPAAVQLTFLNTGQIITLSMHSKPCKLWLTDSMGETSAIEWMQLTGVIQSCNGGDERV